VLIAKVLNAHNKVGVKPQDSLLEKALVSVGTEMYWAYRNLHSTTQSHLQCSGISAVLIARFCNARNKAGIKPQSSLLM
jgi:hypothetical protein